MELYLNCLERVKGRWMTRRKLKSTKIGDYKCMLHTRFYGDHVKLSVSSVLVIKDAVLVVFDDLYSLNWFRLE